MERRQRFNRLLDARRGVRQVVDITYFGDTNAAMAHNWLLAVCQVLVACNTGNVALRN
jgi:hypothetical protein